jgi:hypothetical protein
MKSFLLSLHKLHILLEETSPSFTPPKMLFYVQHSGLLHMALGFLLSLHKLHILLGETSPSFTPPKMLFYVQHSGLLHMALGCWGLLTFGPPVCRGYGSFTFFLIYILGGISGNLMSFLHTPELTVGGTVRFSQLLSSLSMIPQCF